MLLVFAATLFHTSSFLFVVVYIACRKERSGYFYLFSGLLGFIMFVLFSSVIPIIDRFLPSYTKYFTNAQADSYKTTATLAIVLMLILWIIMFFIAKYIREDDDIICPEEYAEKDYDEPDDSMMINYRKDFIMEISVSLPRNVAIGALGMLVLTLVVLTVIYRMDDTIKTSEDLEKVFGVMPLSVIPEGKIKGLKEHDDDSDSPRNRWQRWKKKLERRKGARR